MLDCPELFDDADSHFAALTTYGFNGVFFEERLLRRRALARTRRILVLVDAREWRNSLLQDAPLRWINRRYLVVPIARSTGVFHAKVGLLLGDDQVRVMCSSANLTRPGYSRNLELMNAVSTPLSEKAAPSALRLARSVFAFLQASVRLAEGGEARLATEWLNEEAETNLFLQDTGAEDDGSGPRFMHTLDGPLWPRLMERWQADPPNRLVVISPFYDADHELLTRFVARWPKCKVKFIAQQETSFLDALRAAAVLPRIAIESLDFRSRRLHAKLIAWESSKGIHCLVGSANFTSAALDGRNVEACLWIDDAAEHFKALFDDTLVPEAIAPGEFVAGTEPPPEEEPAPPPPRLNLLSAVLDESGRIEVAYEHGLSRPPDELAVSFRSANERVAAFSQPVPIMAKGTSVVSLPGTEPLAHGTAVRVTLVATLGGERLESAPAWLVQTASLTHEDGSGGGGGDRLARMRDSGEGLAEYTEQLAKDRGIQAVIECLQNFDIRFFDGEGGLRLRRPFSVRMHDPFRSDVPPDWMLNLPDGTKAELRRAVLEFADRHERRCLRKHAKRGNLNGLTNFVDVLRSIVQVLWTYHGQGVLTRIEVLDRIKKYVALATLGTAYADDTHPGFLASLAAHLTGERTLLKQRCVEEGFCEIVAAVLFVGQVLRTESGDSGAGPPLANLPVFRDKLASAARDAGLGPPGVDVVRAGLQALRVFTKEESDRWGQFLS
jgi:hypothetical protein